MGTANGHGATSSVGAKSFFDEAEAGPTPDEILAPVYVAPGEGYTADPGSVIDAELDQPAGTASGSLSQDRERPPPKPAPTTTPPKADEWLDFFSRVILRTLSRWYVDAVFRGIDEDELSEREVDRLILTEDERKQIAQPWAEFANKNKYMRKHGRQVIALAGSVESFVILGGWVMRVNRIAARHRPPSGKVVQGHGSIRPDSQGGTPASNGSGDIGVGIVNPGTS